MNSVLRGWTWVNQGMASLIAHRHWLLLSCILGAAGNTLLFYFVHQPGYDHRANLVGAGIFMALALAVPLKWAYTLISNLALLTALVLMSYVTASTGAINSPAMVWMTIMAVPALLLLGRRSALGWIALIVLVILAQFIAVQQGWLSGEVDQSNETIVWALLDKTLVIVSLMLVVNFYERMHHRQMQEVEDGNTALETTQKALLQAQSHKDEFIASVGHELRTPMNAILGLNGVLQAQLQDQPQNVEIAEHIRQSTEQLLRLVNDILDFAQLEAGRLSLLEQPVHLQSLLRQCVAAHEPAARAKSLPLHGHIEDGVPPWVLADAQRLRQILDKLLDNAIKFTHRGQVQLRIGAMPDGVRFEVQDTGRGIALERQQQVFNRFEHADVQTNRAYGGTGLGLAICERLVSLQQGRIGVHSQPEQGALFWFELPLRVCDAPVGAAADTHASAAQQPGRFLLVDDNAVNLMVARLVVGKCWPEASVTTVNSGERALAVLDETDVDVVLMDMVMPGLDGMQTTRRLRQHPRAQVAQVTVIGLTANTSLREREQCLQAGMDEVLAKPIDSQLLQDVVGRLYRASDSQAPTP